MATIEIRYRNPVDLKEYGKNARKHSEDQITRIANSIAEFGFLNPVLIDDKDILIAGHARRKAALALNLAEIPTINIKHLTPTQQQAYILADNRLAELSDWDQELLSGELHDLLGQEFDLELIGFEDFDFGDDDKEVEEDNAPPLKKEATSKIGDIYQLGEHRVMCGDATDVNQIALLTNNQLADMIFTDPPYNANYSSRVDEDRRKPWGGIINDNMSPEEFKLFLQDVNASLWAYLKEGGSIYQCMDWKRYPVLAEIFGGLFTHKASIIWNKNCFGLGTYYRTKYEIILFGIKGDKINTWNAEHDEMDVWDVSRETNYVHPTQKPTALVARAIKNSSKKGDLVLDLFGGSGSTLMAADQLGRHCYVMELDPKYVDLIVERWENLTGEKAELVSK